MNRVENILEPILFDWDLGSNIDQDEEHEIDDSEMDLFIDRFLDNLADDVGNGSDNIFNLWFDTDANTNQDEDILDEDTNEEPLDAACPGNENYVVSAD